MDVLFQLNNYRHIPHISGLADQVDAIRSKLAQQIISDFHDALEGPNAKHTLPNDQLRLFAEACLVVNALEPKVKNDLLEWFINSELSEYIALFQENEDIAWLDKIDKRYTWLKKHLLDFEERCGRMFPPEWEVSECITVKFCNITSKELAKVMANRSHEINVKLLLFAIGKTSAFESLLAQRFLGITVSDPDKQDNGQKIHPFAGLISSCFEPYLNIYIEAQDSNLNQLINQFVDEQQKSQKQELTKSEILASSGILFTQYKNCLVQCVQLSKRQPLVSLSLTFQKYLREYAHKVLQNNLPRIGSTMSAMSTISNAATGASGGVSVLSAATSAAGLLQSFLKEGEASKFTKSELLQVCSILITANYCLETTQQLEKKLQEKVDSNYVNKINMSAEQDLFSK